MSHTGNATEPCPHPLAMKWDVSRCSQLADLGLIRDSLIKKTILGWGLQNLIDNATFNRQGCNSLLRRFTGNNGINFLDSLSVGLNLRIPEA